MLSLAHMYTVHMHCTFTLQIELFEVETEKKEAMPNLRMRDFLRSEVHTHTHTSPACTLSAAGTYSV